MKRTDFYIIINTESGKKPVKVRGYMFEKCGHWFTVRRRIPSEKQFRKKWIISDFVTGLVMTDTDNSIENVRYALPESSIVRLLGLYDNCAISIQGRRPVREELQQYADMIHAAMFKDNPKSKMLDLHTSQAGNLYN